MGAGFGYGDVLQMAWPLALAFAEAANRRDNAAARLQLIVARAAQAAGPGYEKVLEAFSEGPGR